MAAERRVDRGERDKSDVRPDVLVARQAARQWGVLTVPELRACGLTGHGISRRARNGRLHRLHRGVYAVGHANVPLEGRLLAAVKACGKDAVLSHFAAAAHYAFVRWDGRLPEVTVARSGVRSHPGLRTHRTAVLDPRDIRVHRGIPVTSPARTLLDLAAAGPGTTTSSPAKTTPRARRCSRRTGIASCASRGARRSRGRTRRCTESGRPGRRCAASVELVALSAINPTLGPFVRLSRRLGVAEATLRARDLD